MENLESYGRSTSDRVEHLKQSLSEEERYSYFKLQSFITIWTASIGGSVDINEHTVFFSKTNMYALRQIDACFFKKFGVHIENNAHQLEMSDDEWKHGIKPCSR